MKGKLKILETNQKSEVITQFYPNYIFIVMLLRGNTYVWLGCTEKNEIGTVMHWQPPNVHIT